LKLRIALASIVLFALAAVAAGCGEKQEEADSDAEPFVVALDFYVNPDHAGLFTALERGYFSEAGLDVETQVPSDPSAPIRQVAAGHGTIDQSLTRRIMREFAQRRSLQPVTTSHESDVLTGREQEILRLLAQGMSNDEIARELFVETSTVKSHLARMLPKLGVRSRLQAVVWAYQNRFVDLPEA